MRTYLARAGSVVTICAFLVLPAAPAAAQGERTLRYDVDIAIEASGSILVVERIEYDFAGSYRHGIFRDIPDRLRYDDTYDRVYPIDVLSVEGSPGTPDQYQTEREGELFRIRIGDPDEEITGRHAYTITYRVEGALNGFHDHDELYWNAIGDQWDAPIGSVTVRVRAPGALTALACYAGPAGSTLPCDGAEQRGGEAVFRQRSLDPHGAFTVVVALAKGVVPQPEPVLEERWAIERAFSVTPETVGGAIGLLAVVIGGFAALVWQSGRDRRWRGTPVDVLHGSATGEEEAVPLVGGAPVVVEFAPPDGLRPGQIGTLVDEAANPLDVTATIVDLAVRGHLVIEEIPKEWLLGKPDWTLRRLTDGGDLLEYERRLHDGLFEDGDEVKLSYLKTKFVARLKRVQDALYDDAVARKWFPARPDGIRRRWSLIGAGLLVVGGGVAYLAARYTHAGLVALPLPLGGLLVLAGSKWMPRRTPKGTALRRRILGFREVIDKAEANFARWAEQENVFSKYLPFAIVFGLTEKWAKAFESLGQEPDTSWYVSSRPFVWGGFAESIDGFSVTTAGTIASTPGGSGGSGFGGGGFSGGGGGGGGGGSW